MSDSTPRTLKEELEIRVVALLTGELSEADADELETILTVDTELSAYRDRMAVLIGNVHDARDEIAPGEHTMRLSDERRAEIFKDIDPAQLEVPVEAPKKEVSWQQRVLEWAAVIAVLFITAAIFIPSVGKVRSVSYYDGAEAHFEAPSVAQDMGPPANSFDGFELSEQVALETAIPMERIEGTPQPIRSLEASKTTAPKKQDQRLRGVAQSTADMEGLDFDIIETEEMTTDWGSLELRDDALGMDARTGGSYAGYADASGPVDPFAAPSSLPRAPKPKAMPRPATDKSNIALGGMVGSVSSGSMDAFAAPAKTSTGQRFAKKAAKPADLNFAYDVAPEYASNESKGKKDGMLRSDLPSQESDELMSDLLKSGRAKYLNGDYDGAASTFREVEARDANNAEAKLFQTRIAEVIGEIHMQNQGKTRKQMLASVDQSWERPKVFDVEEETAESSITNPLKTIVIPEVNFSGMPLSEVIDTLSELSVEYDPEHVGVHIVPLFDVAQNDPRVNISLRNLSVDRILEFVTQQVNYSYNVTEDHVLVQPAVAMSEIELHAEARSKNVRQTPKQEKQTSDEAVSTFSLNVSDVSFKLAQAALDNSRVPNPERIRSEEFLNSFDYRDPTPRDNEPVSLNWEVADLPYAHGRQVVRFSLQTQAAGRTASQPLNLNLLIDNSGSMQRPDRRAIMENSLQSLKDKLQPQDQLSIVLFARQPKLIANANTPRSQQAAIDTALAYRPEGGTNLEAGLEVAYDNARAHFDPAASNRVILMTDGAANLGEVNADTLAKQVVEQRKQGIALDAYGIGWDDYNDELLEAITRNGDGRYAFLNSPDQAAENFSNKLAGSLRVAAADVKVQITWNPERVTTYRQVGYDLHQLKAEDFRDNTVDAAEIGEAESGTALYVVQINQDTNADGPLGTLHVRYRNPSTNQYHEQAWPLNMPRTIPELEAASPALRLATASALFAERLAHNPYARNVSFNDLSELTNDLPEAFPTQQRVVDLQNMIHSARILLGDAN